MHLLAQEGGPLKVDFGSFETMILWVILGISVVALHRGEVPVNFMLLMAKQLTIAGSMAYPADYEAMLRMLARADLTPMITHRFPLERFHDALAVARSAGGLKADE